jgi:hypothetical protein
MASEPTARDDRGEWFEALGLLATYPEMEAIGSCNTMAMATIIRAAEKRGAEIARLRDEVERLHGANAGLRSVIVQLREALITIAGKAAVAGVNWPPVPPKEAAPVGVPPSATMLCPKCRGYMFTTTDRDEECPRCKGEGEIPQPPAPAPWRAGQVRRWDTSIEFRLQSQTDDGLWHVTYRDGTRGTVSTERHSELVSDAPGDGT